MKTRPCFLLLAVLLSAFAGCIVNPIYFDCDLIRIPGIEGIWESAEPQPHDDDPFLNREIIPMEGGRYRIIHNDGNNPQYYTAGFLKLGAILFLDMADIRYGSRNEEEEIGTHNILRISLDHDTLRGSLMDLDYLYRCIKSKKYALKYENVNDRSSDYNTGTTIFITASTAELQAFLIANSNDKQLFPAGYDMIFYRGDAAFNDYFPKGSFDYAMIQKRPEAPPILKQAFAYDGKSAALNPLALIDSLTVAHALYRPFYFRVLEFTVANRFGTMDNDVASRFTGYVLANTKEFLHYFNGSPGGGSTTLQLWANAVRRHAAATDTKEEILARLNAAGDQMTAREKRILAAFMKIIAPR